MSENQVQWLFIDMNSFFASVEQQENPSLRGRPVAVLPSMTEYTSVIAASYEAKAFGIKTGTLVRDALEICPHINCVPARHDIYVEYHNRILAEVVRHTPISKVWSIDELSSRLTMKHNDINAAMDLAKRIKDGIAKNIGEHVKCSVGLAPNGYLAKIATDMQKPDGLVVLTRDNLETSLFPLKLRELVGIGANMERRLNRTGIWTVEQLWNTSPKQLRKIWGSVEGEKFWYRLHGYSIPERVEGDKHMVGHSRVLDPAHRHPDMAKQITRRLTVKAAQRLRRYGLVATKFSLSVRTTDGERWAIDTRIPPSCDNLTFIRQMNDLWNQMRDELKPWRLKKASIVMHGLTKPQAITGDLFNYTSPITQKHNQAAMQLSESMDRLNKKYGPNTLHFGACPTTLSEYVGTKIAFARIPDQAEFYE